MGKTVYSEDFYTMFREKKLNAAREILPMIFNLINPSSVIDIGCGTGEWLSIAAELGINDILGMDGDYVIREQLLIPSEKFIPKDLENPISMDRKFDLVMTLEVAEHLSEERASSFVEDLTKLAPVIYFSAAIPFQGGVNHINEQWPEYWIKKFKENNYICIDYIREQVWTNEKVGMDYSQNSFIYVDKAKLSNYKKLEEIYLGSPGFQGLPLVHPQLFLLHRNK